MGRRDGRTTVDGAKVSGTVELLSPLSPLNLALFAGCISATMTGRMRRNRRVSCANSVLSPLLCSGGYGATRVIITLGKLLPNSLFILDAVQCLVLATAGSVNTKTREVGPPGGVGGVSGGTEETPITTLRSGISCPRKGMAEGGRTLACHSRLCPLH